MDKLDRLRLFTLAVELGSLSAAAHRLRITPSAASKGLAQLERELGARLLERNARRLTVTTDGGIYLASCRTAIEGLDGAARRLAESRQELKGQLRISLPTSLGRIALVPHLPELLRRWPGLHIEASFNDRQVDPVTEGYDLVLRVGPDPTARLVGTRISGTQFMTAASPAFLGSSHRLIERPEDLDPAACLRFLLPNRGTVGIWRHGRDGVVHRLTPAGRFTSDDAEALVAAALAGTGIVFMLGLSLLPWFASGALARLLPEWELPGPDIWALYPEDRRGSAKVLAFVEALGELALGGAFGGQSSGKRNPLTLQNNC